MDKKTQACIDIAFRSTTMEGEAVAAFLALRRLKYAPSNNSFDEYKYYDCYDYNKDNESEAKITYGPIRINWASHFIETLVNAANENNCKIKIQIKQEKIISPSTIIAELKSTENNINLFRARMSRLIKYINESDE